MDGRVTDGATEAFGTSGPAAAEFLKALPGRGGKAPMIDVIVCHSPGSDPPKGVDMKLMLRGLLALGVAAAVALTANAAESTAPRLLPAKTTPVTPVVAPAATATANGGCA